MNTATQPKQRSKNKESKYAQTLHTQEQNRKQKVLDISFKMHDRVAKSTLFVVPFMHTIQIIFIL